MALSRVSYTGNGAAVNFSFTFSYIDRTDIFVFVNNVSVPFTFLNTSTITCSVAPAAGTQVDIRRITSKVAAPVNFTDGSVLLERDLDLLATYTLNTAQEVTDSAALSLSQTFVDQADARGLRLANLAPGVAALDVVNKAQLDAVNGLNVKKSGDVMNGSLDMGGNRIVGVSGGVLSTDAATKGQLDTIAGSATAAAASAVQAAASRTAIDDRIYPGTSVTAPTTKPSGAAIAEGDIYCGTDGFTYVRIGAAWVNQTSAAAASAAAALASQNSAGTSAGTATTQAGLATTAKTAAELARDASFVTGPKYSTEAAGRAAVADGVNFLVQGAGAIAAYEYRRLNSGSSTLIATYPSVDGVWQYRGEIASGTSVNALTRAGTYYGAAGSTINDKPASFAGLAFQFFVYDGFGVNSRFQLQEIRQWANPNNCWRRWFDSVNPTANTWVASNAVDGTVNAVKLTTDYSNRGYAATGSANSYVSTGVYLVSAALTDMPAGAPVGGYLEVAVMNDGYLMQTFSSLLEPGKSWSRYIRTSTSTYGAWRSIQLPQDATVAALQLTDDFTNRGYRTTDANTAIKAGVYLVTATIPNLPAGAPTVGYLEVAVGIDGFLIQTYSVLAEPGKMWRRYIRSTTSTFGVWAPVSLPFLGKTIAFVGDSITQIGDYPARVATRTGCTALKLGFSGCRMGAHITDYDNLSMYNLANSINTGSYAALIASAATLTASTGTNYNTPAALFAATNWANVDYMVIAFGTNDWAGAVPIGTIADANGATFMGSINYSVQKILSAYPNIKILFSAPMWRSRINIGDGLDADANTVNGKYLLEFTDAVVNVAAINKLPSVDMYRSSGINKYNAATLLADGLHPAAGPGYQRIADKVSAALGFAY